MATEIDAGNAGNLATLIDVRCAYAHRYRGLIGRANARGNVLTVGTQYPDGFCQSVPFGTFTFPVTGTLWIGGQV